MSQYSKYALRGFAVGLGASILLSILLDVVPWGHQQELVLLVYLSLSAAYVAAFPPLVRDIFARKGVWVDRRLRTYSVPFAGASVGIFLLGWMAIFFPSDFHKLAIMRLNPLVFHLQQAQELISQADLLALCKTFVDNVGQFALSSAAIAMVCAWLYDQYDQSTVPPLNKVTDETVDSPAVFKKMALLYAAALLALQLILLTATWLTVPGYLIPWFIHPIARVIYLAGWAWEFIGMLLLYFLPFHCKSAFRRTAALLLLVFALPVTFIPLLAP